MQDKKTGIKSTQPKPKPTTVAKPGSHKPASGAPAPGKSGSHGSTKR